MPEAEQEEGLSERPSRVALCSQDSALMLSFSSHQRGL